MIPVKLRSIGPFTTRHVCGVDWEMICSGGRERRGREEVGRIIDVSNGVRVRDRKRVERVGGVLKRFRREEGRGVVGESWRIWKVVLVKVSWRAGWERSREWPGSGLVRDIWG